MNDLKQRQTKIATSITPGLSGSVRSYVIKLLMGLTHLSCGFFVFYFRSGDSGSADGCVAMIAPSLQWEAQDCTLVKDFICEQTRCYYYNYGSIPVSANQG